MILIYSLLHAQFQMQFQSDRDFVQNRGETILGLRISVTLRIAIALNLSHMSQNLPSTRKSTEELPDQLVTEPKPSYVKLAMRNMVRKSGTSLRHFGLTVMGLLAALIGLAYLTR